MREIVHVQIGQAGNRVGGKFWEVISDEHGLGPDGEFRGDSELQLHRIGAYFAEGGAGRYAARAIAMDPDRASLEAAVADPGGSLFRPENVVAGRGSAANTWARGRYSEGAELVELALDPIRAEAEACELMQGIQIVRSLGGGSGSGTGSLLLGKLSDEYPDRILHDYSVIPSSETSDAVLEPYNAVLGLVACLEFAAQTFCLDNAALHRVCSRVLELNQPTLADANRLVSCCMATITACFRFPARPNTDLRKLRVNLVPFPRLHFFVPGYAPLQSRSAAPYRAPAVPDLTQRLFHADSALVRCEPGLAKVLTLAAIFRGPVSTKLVEEQMAKARDRGSPRFVEWIPGNVSTTICDVAPRGLGAAAGSVSNTTAIREPFGRLLAAFDAMLGRRAYLHWYTAEGMEEAEFVDARNAVDDLLDEYRQQGDAEPETDFVEEPVEDDE